jgi:hypothetical protein
MPDSLVHIRSAEDRAQQLLAPALSDWTTLTEELQQMKLELLREPWKPNRPTQVAFFIVARLLNELRAVVTLAERGYAVQAFSNVATMAELAFMVGYIGDDETRATGWMTHYDNAWPFATVKKTITATVQLFGLPQEAAKTEHEHYQFVCMAKHGNPQVFSKFGHTKTGDDVTVPHGPYVTREVESLSRVVLWYACYYFWRGLAGYRKLHLVEPARGLWFWELQRVRFAMDDLREADIAKYEQ